MSSEQLLSAPAPETGRQRPFTYAYLVSAPHSGSTLMACLLAAHPQITSVGEFGSDFSKENLRCSCGAGYLKCDFWREWMDMARREGIEFDVTAPNLNLVPRPNHGLKEELFYHLFPFKAANRLRDLMYRPGMELCRRADRAIYRSVRLAELICERQGTRVFFDSTKNPLQIRFLARCPGLRLKVVSLIRDGRGVMHSNMKHYGLKPDEAIDVWLWSVRNQARALAHYMHSANVLEIRLKDMCRDPQQHMRRLFEFLEVSPDVQLDYSDKSRRHVTGNLMRTKFDGTIRFDETWRTKLAPQDLRLFEARAGRVNRRYGYLD